MKSIYSFLLYFLGMILFTSCISSVTKVSYKNIINTRIDSFSVTGLEDLPEDLVRFSYLNDSTCCTIENQMKDLCLFKSVKGSKHFILVQKEPSLEGLKSIIIFLKGYYNVDNNLQFLVGDYSNHCLNVYNSEFKLLKKSCITYRFPHLADKYFFSASTQMHPAYIVKDTLITGVTIDNQSLFNAYYADALFVKLKITRDSISFISTFGRYTNGVRDYYPPISFYTWGNGSAWVLYPAFDTIFSYKINDGHSRKIAIHNPDFVLPEKWKSPPYTDQKYFSKLSKYNIENFKYQGIVFDKCSGNLVLWYQKPHKMQSENGLLKISDEGVWYILIINQQGHLLRQYKINKDTYMPFIFQTPEGLAIPRYGNNLVHEKAIHFDVFNL